MNVPRSRTFLLLCCLVIAGCAVQPRIPGTEVAWDARRDALLALECWSLKGRIAVQSADEGGQGSLQWRQSGDSARLRFSGPLGAGARELLWNPQEVVLTDGKGRATAAYAGPDALERFLDEQLGWRFPAERARYWVLGVAAPPGRGRSVYDDAGWLDGINQHGWEVRYDDFRERGGYWMPRKVRLDSARASVKMVVDDWQPNCSPSPGIAQ